MICVIGGGHLGSTLIAALVNAGIEVTAVERNPKNRERLSQQAGVTVSDKIVPGDGVIISVKPKDVEAAVNDAVAAGATRILSVAAGISLAKLHEWAGKRVPVLRAMPNIAAKVGQSATAFCVGFTAHEEDHDWAIDVLSKFGSVVEVSEETIDVATALAGCGPAYIAMVVEALIDGSVALGLPRAQAAALASQMLSGSAALLSEDGADAATMRTQVTTPGGVTAAGIASLERNGLRHAFNEALSAATARSKEIAKTLQ